MKGAGLKTITIALTIAAICLLNSCKAQNGKQVARLFAERGSREQSLSLGVVNFPNLQQQGFDNRAFSACVTGVWVFYENANFNTQRGLIEYIYGPDNKCSDFTHVAGRISSARYVGYPSDYKANTLTLYEGDFFQGRQEYTFSDLPALSSLDRRASSLILTGLSPWTVYALPNFQGEAFCIYPPQPSFSPALISNTDNIGIPQGTIRSVRLGCSGRVLVIPPHPVALAKVVAVEDTNIDTYDDVNSGAEY